MQIPYLFKPDRLPQFGSLSWAIALLGTWACSSNTSTGTSSTLPVAYSDFATTLAHAYCSSISACCSQAGYSTATCESTLKAELDAFVATLAADPHIEYDAAAGARLIDAIVAVNTACTDEALSDSMNIKLSDVFHGTVELGGSCGQSNDCVTPDGGYVTCDAGICEAQASTSLDGPRVSAGQPCNATCSGTTNSYGCTGVASAASSAVGNCWVQDGLYCSSNGTCVAAPLIGQTCGDYYYCEAAGHCESGTCVADTASGACTNDDDCVTGTFCDYNAQVCTALKANGTGCNSDGECAGGQCEQDRCRTWSVATAASCAGLLD